MGIDLVDPLPSTKRELAVGCRCFEYIDAFFPTILLIKFVRRDKVEEFLVLIVNSMFDF